MRISQEALTFDDVLLLPAHSKVLPHAADLKTKLTATINLNIPIISAAMDTVSEARMAISLAQEGGMGCIHKSMSIEQQAEHVRLVKKFESGIVHDPITVSPHATIAELKELTRRHRISGVPVVDGENLVGIVTSRDVRFETELAKPVASVMTPKERLVTVLEGADSTHILSLMHKHRIEKILVVDEQFRLRGLITVKDIQKAEQKPNACKDRLGHLRVAAAVGTGVDTEDRIAALMAVGVDVVVVDTSHGHSQGVLDVVARIKKRYGKLPVIAGNVATAAGAKALVDAGADAVKVGIGPGSICTTRIVTGVGVPQLTAISNVADALKNTAVPIIADGGIRFSGDVAKAIAAGAHVVMMGSLLAGTDEAPGEIELYQGRSYKSYRGMGSLGAMAQRFSSKDRYFQASVEAEKLVPEGIEGRVPYRGSVVSILHQLMGGVRAAMGLTGCASIEALRTQAEFVKITAAGSRESHAHDVTITKEAPNYWVD